MNIVILGGYLGEDPELRFTNSDQAVCKMRMATTSRYKDSKTGEWQKMSEWHNVVVWGKRGEALAGFLRKGEYITVTGELRTRQWETKEGEKRRSTEVIAKDVETTGRGQNRGDYQEDQEQRPKRKFVPEDEPQTGFS